jgi:exosome complex RNA-binding protein Rrp4
MNHYYINLEFKNSERIFEKEKLLLSKVQNMSQEKGLEIIYLHMRGNPLNILGRHSISLKKNESVKINKNINNTSALLKWINEVNNKICIISGNGFNSEILFELKIQHSFLICYTNFEENFFEWIENTRAIEI